VCEGDSLRGDDENMAGKPTEATLLVVGQCDHLFLRGDGQFIDKPIVQVLEILSLSRKG